MTSHDAPIFLYAPYFAAKTAERQREFDLCLQRNVDCRAIEKIFLLVDDGHTPPFSHDKIQIVSLDRRPTYRQWYDFGREAKHRGISILANTDIYFDESVKELRKVLREPDTFVALSRFELEGTKLTPHPNPHWSQDVWAMHAEASLPGSLYRSLDIPLGVPRCDNKVAYLFAIHGWKLVNPCRHVRSVHVHETQQRNYDKRRDLTVMGGVAYVHPGEKLDDAAEIEVDLWAKRTQAIKRVALNKSLDKWAEAEPVQAKQESKCSAPSQVQHAEVARKEEACAVSDVVSAGERLRFLTQGEIAYDHLSRFRVYRHQNQLLCLDSLNPRTARRRKMDSIAVEPTSRLMPELLAVFLPPVIDTFPIVVRDRPTEPTDCQFWQYPCATENQAYGNHLAIGLGENIDRERGIINTYVGLPWATYIDKKNYPAEVVAIVKPKITGMQTLAAANGYSLALHTVCQHIHWRRFVDHFHELGVTDLHLSHCEKSIDPQRDGYRFRVHSWPLIAVNVEDPTRSTGLVIGKPIAEKRYLASFIGAHMPHYRSDVRLKLLEAAKTDGGDDILVDLGGEWHFNKVVYQEQVANKSVKQEDLDTHDVATRRYNQILSDSIFSLCPEGAGPNTLRLWESLAVGSIPVILADEWVPPQLPNSESDISDCCLFYSINDVSTLFSELRTLSRTRIKAMQAGCLAAYRHLRSRTACLFS